MRSLSDIFSEAELEATRRPLEEAVPPPAIANANCDALSPFGWRTID